MWFDRDARSRRCPSSGRARARRASAAARRGDAAAAQPARPLPARAGGRAAPRSGVRVPQLPALARRSPRRRSLCSRARTTRAGRTRARSRSPARRSATAPTSCSTPARCPARPRRSIDLRALRGATGDVDASCARAPSRRGRRQGPWYRRPAAMRIALASDHAGFALKTTRAALAARRARRRRPRHRRRRVGRLPAATPSRPRGWSPTARPTRACSCAARATASRSSPTRSPACAPSTRTTPTRRRWPPPQRRERRHAVRRAARRRGGRRDRRDFLRPTSTAAATSAAWTRSTRSRRDAATETPA